MSQSTTNFILGLVVGAAVGAAIGLLYAPTSGKELQQQAEYQWKELAYTARRAADDKRAALEARLAKLKAGQTD